MTKEHDLTRKLTLLQIDRLIDTLKVTKDLLNSDNELDWTILHQDAVTMATTISRIRSTFFIERLNQIKD